MIGFALGLLFAAALSLAILVCLVIVLLVAAYVAWLYLGPLLALIPLLPQLQGALRLAAQVLRDGNVAMETLQTGLNTAADNLDSAGRSASTFTLVVPTFHTELFAGVLYYVKDVQFENKKPLQAVSTQLTNAVAGLKTNLTNTFDPAQTNMVTAATALDTLADALALVPTAPPGP